jgi:hypothetical protein
MLVLCEALPKVDSVDGPLSSIAPELHARPELHASEVASASTLYERAVRAGLGRRADPKAKRIG